jgi:hypothetical protein
MSTYGDWLDLAAPETGIDACDDAHAPGYPRSEHERQGTKDAQERDLPPLLSYADVMDDLPELAPELIGGVLRQGHKMTVAGPSKSGKSFALIALAIGIAEGTSWLGWPCARGPVVYCNFELDAASFWHRIHDVYAALGLEPDHAADIHVWNLRGHAREIGELADDLVSIVDRVRPMAIVLDPVYKVFGGLDENSAGDWGRFTRHLDDVATRSGAAVCLCHHHSKGSQGAKASRDRASGSGVISRDPDALIDISELANAEDAREGLLERLSVARLTAALNGHSEDWPSRIGPDQHDSRTLRALGRELLPTDTMNALISELETLARRVQYAKPLEVSLTLREFAEAPARKVWYLNPLHIAAGAELEAAHVSGAVTKKDYAAATVRAFEALAVDGETTVTAIAEYLGVSERQARTRVDKAGLKRDAGTVTQ